MTFDGIVHQQHRLRIMAALDNERGPLDFSTLKAISGATDGNLGAHLNTLETAGYISIEKEPVGARHRSWVRLTAAGRDAFRRHIAYLQSLVDTASNQGAGS